MNAMTHATYQASTLALKPCLYSLSPRLPLQAPQGPVPNKGASGVTPYVRSALTVVGTEIQFQTKGR
eukprot:1157566-Pelagomonas_calceolata.AAC.5